MANFLNCIQKTEEKVTGRKLLKMFLEKYFSRIQDYIYPHVVAVILLYLGFLFGIHYNAFQKQLQYFNKDSQVSRSRSFQEKNCGS